MKYVLRNRKALNCRIVRLVPYRIILAFVLTLIFFSACGFFDSEKAISKPIVGNIFIANANLPEDSGYYLTFLTPADHERQLLKGRYVEQIRANDSIIIAKAFLGSITI